MADEVVHTRIVVVQCLDPSVELSPGDGLRLFALFKTGSLLLVVRRTVSVVVGRAATELLEHLMDLRTVTATDASPRPTDRPFPAQWAYDQARFVRLFNPSIAALRRIDGRSAHRYHVEAVRSRSDGRVRMDGALGAAPDVDPRIAAELIDRVMDRMPRPAGPIDAADTDAAVFLGFDRPRSSIDLQAWPGRRGPHGAGLPAGRCNGQTVDFDESRPAQTLAVR